jgi:hypothetical protein
MNGGTFGLDGVLLREAVEFDLVAGAPDVTATFISSRNSNLKIFKKVFTCSDSV